MSLQNKYKPSGRFGIDAFLWVPLYGIPTGLILAFVYAYVTLYIPVVGYISALIALGLGLGTGYAVSGAIKRAKVRNQPLAFSLGTLIGLFTLYFMWVAWAFALLSREGQDVSIVAIALQPQVLWRFMLALNETGAWSVKGLTPSGVVLGVFWGIEALIIVGAPAFFALTFAESPFCEKCSSWCKEHFGIFAIEAVEKEELTRRLQQFDIDFIAAIPPASKGTMSLLRFDLHSCPCRQTDALSVLNINRLIKKGKENQKIRDFF